MKILIAHNVYKERGGEEAVVDAESHLLTQHGHEVILYRKNNDQLTNLGPLTIASAGIAAIWAQHSYRSLKHLLLREKPDVAHFHNIFPLISPSAYYACSDAGVPIVQTLHNYRLLCAGGQFLRDGQVCESCLGRHVGWPGVAYACYRDSRLATAAVAGMLAAHRVMGTWRTKVNLYIALSKFARLKFVQGGLPADRIVVKPNFASSDANLHRGRGEFALFVGRLSCEKGLHLLLNAWHERKLGIPLQILGDGLLRAELQEEAGRFGLTEVSFWGRVSESEMRQHLDNARFLLMPSIWYEGFPIAIAEAFARGVPVVCSRIGSLEEIVHHGRTGLHFETGNATDLATKVEWAWTHPAEMQEMGRAARAEYEDKYTPDQNYKLLMEIYEQATCTSKRVTADSVLPQVGRGTQRWTV